ALRVIAESSTSVAIFAPGWTHEFFGSQRFLEADARFWRGVGKGACRDWFPVVKEGEEGLSTAETDDDLGCVADFVASRPSGTATTFFTDFDRGFGTCGYFVDGM
ncbi:hypothetical protein HDU67_005953, partial [Dinochytrium kinnereticum]